MSENAENADQNGRKVRILDQGTLVPIAFVVVVVGGVLWLTSSLNRIEAAAETRANTASSELSAVRNKLDQVEQRLNHRLDSVDARISGVVQTWELRSLFLRMQIDNPTMKIPEVR